MGWTHIDDTRDEHEGWVAMTFPDGAVGIGVSTGVGHAVAGYEYGAGEDAIGTDLRPFDTIIGWLPRCACGWFGVEAPRTDPTADRWGEPTEDEEMLIMDQWRLHLRDTIGAHNGRDLEP